MAEKISWCCALLMAMLLVVSSCEVGDGEFRSIEERGVILRKPCDEIYVVKEGETLHTISEKCGDPFIVEQNPHIHDPDDVFPGLVIKITPFNFRVHNTNGESADRGIEAKALCNCKSMINNFYTWRNRVAVGSTTFENPLKPCCVGTSSEFSCGSVDEKGAKMYTVCDNAEAGFFWDNVHPIQEG